MTVPDGAGDKRGKILCSIVYVNAHVQNRLHANTLRGYHLLGVHGVTVNFEGSGTQLKDSSRPKRAPGLRGVHLVQPRR